MQVKCHHDVLLNQVVRSMFYHCFAEKTSGVPMAYDSRGRHWRCFIICLHSSKSSPTHLSFLQIPEGHLYHPYHWPHCCLSLDYPSHSSHTSPWNPTSPRGYPSHSTSSQKSSLKLQPQLIPPFSATWLNSVWIILFLKLGWGWMKQTNCAIHVPS